MANKYIKDLSENTAPSATDAVEIDDGTNSEYVTLLNLLKGAVTPGTSGNVLTSDGTNWTSAAGSSGGGGDFDGLWSVTVASNNITLALKNSAGSDPSAGSPVHAKIGGISRTISSALSVTVNAGASTFASGSAELGTKEIDYFPYLSWRAANSDIVVGYSRIPYARLFSEFSATSTNEKYAAFSTAPASTDTVENMGRFAATLGLVGTGHLWTVPSYNSINLVQKPCFETRWLAWQPVFTGFTATVPTGTYAYKLSGEMCLISQLAATNGTSNATTFTQTFPFTFASANPSAGIVNAWDNGAGQAALAQMQTTAGSATAAYYKTFYQAAWTNAGAKNVYCPDFQYRLR
jgi:hypothetical protein